MLSPVSFGILALIQEADSVGHAVVCIVVKSSIPPMAGHPVTQFYDILQIWKGENISLNNVTSRKKIRSDYAAIILV